MPSPYERPFVQALARRLQEPEPRIQVVLGPRQVGKTTGVRQLISAWTGPSLYASADALADPRPHWLAQQWERARDLAKPGQRCLLALDEVQKIEGWSEETKRLWDEDLGNGSPLGVCLLGSSAMMVARGLNESLAGRFERVGVGHWQYAEMRDTFGWDLDTFLYFGGYPGAARYRQEPARWAEYINGSLIDSAIGRDVLALNTVEKPALLRRLFVLACGHPAEILSYNKMLGQLSDAGNASTLAHYQNLLDTAGLLRGLPKFNGTTVRHRASSPKWLPLNTALVTAQRGLSPKEYRNRPDLWGRLVEAAVGAHLAAEAERIGARLEWWREGNFEVDYVVRKGEGILGLEVKSGEGRLRSPLGLGEFRRRFPKARTLVLGTGGLPLEECFTTPLERWLG